MGEGVRHLFLGAFYVKWDAWDIFADKLSFKTKMNNRNPFTSILHKYRSLAFSERDKGDRFERLMQAYLLTDKQYADQLSNVWLWNEFPSRHDFGGKDTGIDLVARTVQGDY